jgi:hypothetical protein
MKKLMLLGALTGSLGGCYWNGTMSTPSGLREHHRGVNGSYAVIRDRQDDPYHELQRKVETEKTIRIQLGRTEQ